MSDGITIDIAIDSDHWSSVANIRALADAAVAVAVEKTRLALRPGAEVSIFLCDDRFIQGLNAQWRGQDKPTNVLSFPAPGLIAQKQALGDIAIAYETTAREAAEEDKSFDHHFIHLVVHGFLHLAGYDHEREAEAVEMERLERDILAELGIANPYRLACVESAE